MRGGEALGLRWVDVRLDPAPTTSALESPNHQHQKIRKLLKLPQEFVLHSLRHTMLTRLGESGADAFTIMRIARHSSITVSQKYVHPTPELLERAIERLEALHREQGGTNVGTVVEPDKIDQGVNLLV